MAVILAVLTTLFLILTMVLKISDLLVPSSSSQTKDKSRIEAKTVEKTEGGYDCDGSSALYDADELTGRIAYVCNGDIYRMDLATGEVARLSHGANYSWFDWSPDGEKIAWADREFGDLWVWDVGGASPSQLSNESFAAFAQWSPDGKTLAFASAGIPDKRAGLAMIPVNGTGFRQKTILSQDEDLDGGSVGGLDWSPNGEKIHYENLSNRHRDLFVVNADGTGRQRLTTVRSSAEDLNRIHNILWLP